MRLTFGAQIPGNQTQWPAMKDTAQAMDATRWHSAWTYDHFVPPLAFMDETGDSLEGWTALTAIGAVTETLMLGTLVSGVTYRNPGLIAKMTATLDHVTEGRAILGIGAAWHEREHAAYGWDFPALKERSDRLEEACNLIRQLFHGPGPVDFQGEYYRLDQCAVRAAGASAACGAERAATSSRSWWAATGRSGRCARWGGTATSSTRGGRRKRWRTRSRW